MSIRSHLSGHSGQTTAEYGMVLGVVAIAVAVAMTFLSGSIQQVFSLISSQI